jgi:hypothetical protein
MVVLTQRHTQKFSKQRTKRDAQRRLKRVVPSPPLSGPHCVSITTIVVWTVAGVGNSQQTMWYPFPKVGQVTSATFSLFVDLATLAKEQKAQTLDR